MQDKTAFDWKKPNLVSNAYNLSKSKSNLTSNSNSKSKSKSNSKSKSKSKSKSNHIISNHAKSN